jgi:hypothetical protein
MSGWNIPYLSELVLGLFMVAVGAMLLLDPIMAAREEARAHDFKLRYGDGGTDLRRAVPRWPGWLFIALGVAHIVLPSRSGQSWLITLVMGGFLLVCGLLGVLLTPRAQARRLRRHEAELAELEARASDYAPDTYAQELRALQANRPFVTSRQRQWFFTALFALFGGAFLTLGLIGARQ